jgi:hypothetical protein
VERTTDEWDGHKEKLCDLGFFVVAIGVQSKKPIKNLRVFILGMGFVK